MSLIDCCVYAIVWLAAVFEINFASNAGRKIVTQCILVWQFYQFNFLTMLAGTCMVSFVPAEAGRD